jgi:tetratricopeptide (TPR) repeat protein
LRSRAQEASPASPPPAQEPANPNQQAVTEPPLPDARKIELRGDVCMARKQYSDAVQQYEAALKLEPKNAVLLNKVGIAYHGQTELDKARKYYKRSVKADKKYASVHNNLGALYYDMRKYRQAVNEFRKAIELRPDFAQAYSGLGSAYFARKKYEDAIAALRRAVELDPGIFDRGGTFGTVVQSGVVADRSLFYFLLAKSFALQKDAGHCAHYLLRARDEGYKGMDQVAKDPAFADVIKDPQVQAVLNPSAPPAVRPPSSP